jgi:CDP-diacylglycerol--glycerol-3-phosphate 3-phosphatidyltransferase
VNVANRITLVRIFLVPLIVFFLLVKFEPLTHEIRWEHFSITYSQMIATIIFIVSALTDGLDGYLARKHNLVTNLGKLLDPLADKVLITAVLVSLVEMDKLDAWIAIVIISREFAVSGLRMIGLLEGVVLAASKWGKWKTGLQITAIIAIMLNNFPFALVHFRFDLFAVWIAAIVTLYSGLDYFIKNKGIIASQV